MAAIDGDLVGAILGKAMQSGQAAHPSEIYFGTVTSAAPLNVTTEDGLTLTERMLVPLRRRFVVRIDEREMLSPLAPHQHPGSEGGISPDKTLQISIDWKFKAGQRVVVQRVQGAANVFIVLGEVDDELITYD